MVEEDTIPRQKIWDLSGEMLDNVEVDGRRRSILAETLPLSLKPGKAWERDRPEPRGPHPALLARSFPPAVLCEIRNPTVDEALKGIPDFAANPWLEKKVFVLLSPEAVELSLVVPGLDNGSLSEFHPGVELERRRGSPYVSPLS